MDQRPWYRHHHVQLRQLCPPFEAAGFGGSPESHTDQYSDIDCFLLAPEERLSELTDQLPVLLDHPVKPIISWDRGWHAGFGYQITYIYPGMRMVDYFINSRHTLAASAMVAKTRVIVDRTGYYTRFVTQLVGHAIPEYSAQLSATEAEFIVELIKIRKYAARGALCAIAHRFERLRLMLLALHKMEQGEVCHPHDADKEVDLSSNFGQLIFNTFATPDPEDLIQAFAVLYDAISSRLTGSKSINEDHRRLQEVMQADIMGTLRRAIAQ